MKINSKHVNNEGEVYTFKGQRERNGAMELYLEMNGSEIAINQGIYDREFMPVTPKYDLASKVIQEYLKMEGCESMAHLFNKSTPKRFNHHLSAMMTFFYLEVETDLVSQIDSGELPVDLMDVISQALKK